MVVILNVSVMTVGGTCRLSYLSRQDSNIAFWCYFWLNGGVCEGGLTLWFQEVIGLCLSCYMHFLSL